MKWVIRISGIIACCLLLVPINPVFADSPALIISELKIRNDTTVGGLDEFIEIFNPGLNVVNLNNYLIGYTNTPSPAVDQQLSTFVIADGMLEPGKSLLLAKNDTDPNLPHAKKLPFSSLSDSGGTLRIIDAQNTIIDQVAWTSTQSLAIAPVQYQCTASNTGCNANKSQSLNRTKDSAGQYLLTNPGWQLAAPSPHSDEILAVPALELDPEPEPAPAVAPEPSPDTAPDPDPSLEPQPVTQPPDATATSPDDHENPPDTTLMPPLITELLPNPAPPATDSADEYIELYNPNDQPLNLSGYKLQSGNGFSYSYTFPSLNLAPHEYKAFYVTETGDVLSNSGGQARLLDPNGVVIAQTNLYDSANDGDAWAFVNGAWQWTTSPTPNEANELVLPVLKVAAIKPAATKTNAAPKSSAAKPAAAKAATPKATTTKAAAAKTASAKAAKTTTPADRQVYQDPAEAPPALHPGILAGVGLITLLYAVYEYRHDVFNYYRRFRRYREVRRATRTPAQGR